MRLASCTTFLLACLTLVASNEIGVCATLTCVESETIRDDDPDQSHLVTSLETLGYSSPKTPVCTTARLDGEIAEGDATRFSQMLQSESPFLGHLEFNSRGGCVDEAMAIGRLVRGDYIATEAPLSLGNQTFWATAGKLTSAPDQICASACFLAWLGGVIRVGNAIGIHRPYPKAAELQRLSPSDSAHIYANLSHRITTYLAEVGAASHWLDDMMAVSSDDIHLLSQAQSDELTGDARTGFSIPSFAQWAFSKCGSLTVDEWEDLHTLALGGTIPEHLGGYHAYLNKRESDVLRCEHQEVVLARWQLHHASH